MATKLKKPFKTLHGSRLVLPFPIIAEETVGGVILTPSAQEAQAKEALDDYLKVEVIQTGVDCKRGFSEGDIIFIPPRVVQPGRSDMLTVSDTEKYLIINEQDVVGTW